MTHYGALFCGYAVALFGWWICATNFSGLWPKKQPLAPAHPWREVGLALLACMAVLLIGQAFIRDWLLPRGAWVMMDVANQILIFSPAITLVCWRGQGLETAWLPKGHLLQRVGLGMCLAVLALMAHHLAHPQPMPFSARLIPVFAMGNLEHLVQVFLEDLIIAMLFVRFRNALGTNITILMVAILFAAGHIPAILAGGGSIADFAPLILDAALGVGILTVLWRSKDILWFCWVHYAMDMMQFAGA